MGRAALMRPLHQRTRFYVYTPSVTGAPTLWSNRDANRDISGGRKHGDQAMAANSVSIGILGATGYTGAELLRLLYDHPSARVDCMTAERYAGQPIEAVFPHLNGRELPRLTKVGDYDLGSLDVVFGCLPHGTTQDVIRELPRGPRGDRPLGRFPAARSGALRADLRPAAPGDRAPEGCGLRPDRAGAGRDRAHRPRCQSRLLSDHGAAAAPPAARSRADRARSDHHRCQVGGNRRRARGQGDLAAQRGERRPARLRRDQPPPRAGDRAGPGRCRRPAGQRDLHAAPRAHEPRHSGDDLRPPGAGRRGRRSAGRARATLRRGAVRARAAVQEPARDPPRPRHQSLPDRGASGPGARAGRSSSRSSTIWSRAPPARRCRT